MSTETSNTPATHGVTTWSEFEKIEKNSKNNKSKRGGRREGSGRKTKENRFENMGISAMIDMHASEEVEVRITDKRTGLTRVETKPRPIVILEKLFDMGIKGDARAIAVWLDRAYGKPAMAIQHSGTIGTANTQKDLSKAEIAAGKAYRDASK